MVAGLLALFLLAVFILVNYYRHYQVNHEPSGHISIEEPEKLPEAMNNSGRQLAFYDFESGNCRDTSMHISLKGHGGTQSFRMTPKVEFSPGLWIKFKDLNPGDSSWIRATGYVWFSCPPAGVKCNLVVTCNHKGVNYKYMFVALETLNLKPNQWNLVSIDYHIPQAPDREDVLQAYFWYRGSSEMLADDFKIEFFNLKKNH